MPRVMSVVGLVFMLGIAWLLSSNRRAVRWRTVGWGLGLQLILGILILKTSWGYVVFDALGGGAEWLLKIPEEGSRFVFGALMDPEHLPQPILALSVLPTVIFFSSLISILYHLGVMQKMISAMAWVMRRTMGTSGCESLGAAANVFVGPVESALAVRPYVARMTSSELMALMTTGMATVAGSVMAAYVAFVSQAGINPAHLLSAGVMSAPAALAIAKLMVPETKSVDSGAAEPEPMKSANIVDAAAGGAAFGLKLALSIAAMLIAFVSLVALVNAGITWAGDLAGAEKLTLQRILGYVFWPFAWIMGVPTGDCAQVGSLLGEKTVINEFIAYSSFSGMKEVLSERSRIITTYALCGFANPGTIGILIAGLGGIAPERSGEIARLGFRSLIGGTLATFMTATIAGMLL